jgi:alpha-ketoglutarate-dependent taurine dioxygenase
VDRDASPPEPGASHVSATSPGNGFGAAVVEGLDPLPHAADPSLSAWLRALLWEHGVVCLRQPAALTDDEHRAVVSMIGRVKDPVGVDVDRQPLRYGDEKQIIDSGFVLTDELRAELGDLSFGGDDLRPGLFEHFHTDDSYVEYPAAVTVLHARDLPSGPGGATSFIDMRASFELLDPDERSALLGLHAVHAYNNYEAFPPRASAGGPLERLIDVSHPIVRAHPVTGTPALYFDLDRACRVEGLPEAAGRDLLQSLQDRAERDGPRYAHAWQPHDVLLWDNASVQHKAGSDFAVGEPRRFWRYMAEGTRPMAYAPPS